MRSPTRRSTAPSTCRRGGRSARAHPPPETRPLEALARSQSSKRQSQASSPDGMISERPPEVQTAPSPATGRRPPDRDANQRDRDPGRAPNPLLPARRPARGTGAEEVADALKASITTLPVQLRRSLTWIRLEMRSTALLSALPSTSATPSPQRSREHHASAQYSPRQSLAESQSAYESPNHAARARRWLRPRREARRLDGSSSWRALLPLPSSQRSTRERATVRGGMTDHESSAFGSRSNLRPATRPCAVRTSLRGT